MSLLSSIKNRWDLIVLRMKISREQRSSKNSSVVIIDNTSEKGNWIINKSNIAVTVLCSEMFGAFSVHLRPGQKQLVTNDVIANVYPEGSKFLDDVKNYDDEFKYHLDEGERWEIHNDRTGLIMVKK